MSLERLPKEHEKAYLAFLEYARMGPDRSLKALIQTGRTLQRLKDWSSNYCWQQRLRDYSNHLAKVEMESAEAMVKAGATDWARRQEEQREEEWRVRCELLE